jgi:hypothetical protein
VPLFNIRKQSTRSLHTVSDKMLHSELAVGWEDFDSCFLGHEQFRPLSSQSIWLYKALDPLL